MKKLIISILMSLFLVVPSFAAEKAKRVSTDTTNFDNNLSSSDTTVQKALETLDELVGGGGGDSITVNSTAATNANFLDNLFIDWTLVTASTPDDITAAWNLDETLAGNPALDADNCVFGADASGFYFICEGSTANTNEQLYRFPDIDTEATHYFLATSAEIDPTAISAFLDEDNMASDSATALASQQSIKAYVDSQDHSDHGDGANCSSGNYPLGVDENGAVQSCTADDDVPEAGDYSNLTCGDGINCPSTGTVETASNEAGFLESGALTCGAGTAGKVQVHTTPGQYCDNSATPTLRYMAYGASDGDSLAGDSATSFFDAGTLEHERGGLEADVSAYNGLIRISGGATSNITNLAGLNTALGSSVADGAHTTDTGPSPDCSGTTTYQDGEGNCDDIDPVYENELDNSAGLLAALSDETGSGLAVFGTSPTIATPILTGKIDRNNVAVDDDDCTGEQGFYWYDTTDSAFEFCNANSGAPTVLGGGATSKLSVELPVQSAKISGSFATNGDATQGATIDAGDGNWRLLFDASTDEGVVWQFRMPNNYSSAPILKVGYSLASATTLEVEFEGAIMCVSDGDAADIGTASFSTIAVSSETVPGTAGHPSEVSITLNDDSCASGDAVFVYLSTDADDATNDDATGDREVFYVSLTYTVS